MAEPYRFENGTLTKNQLTERETALLVALESLTTMIATCATEYGSRGATWIVRQESYKGAKELISTFRESAQ